MIYPKRLSEIFEDAKKRVTVNCDEYHAHDYKCISPTADGDYKDVTICELYEEVMRLRGAIFKVAVAIQE